MNAKYKAENEIQGSKLKLFDAALKEKEEQYRELHIKYVNVTKNQIVSKSRAFLDQPKEEMLNNFLQEARSKKTVTEGEQATIKAILQKKNEIESDEVLRIFKKMRVDDPMDEKVNIL
jgi:hypothetical protein